MASKLFTPGKIGTLELPNRLLRSATQDPFGRRDGTCAPEQVDLYGQIAASGVGAIITAYSYISPEARSTGIQVGFATEEQRASQKEVLDAVHAAGGRLILQIMHAGMNVFMPEKRVEGGKLLAPTGGLTAPNEMTTTEITPADMDKICADFVDAAQTAKALGFDGVQLHCAHGYLLSQFLVEALSVAERHYLAMTVKGSVSVRQAAEYMLEKGVERCYALDGGQSGTIAMQGLMLNPSMFGGYHNGQRIQSDIIYFASAIPEDG